MDSGGSHSVILASFRGIFSQFDERNTLLSASNSSDYIRLAHVENIRYDLGEAAPGSRFVSRLSRNQGI